MRYLYSFVNATLAMRVIDYLRCHLSSNVQDVTVIYLTDRWLLNIVLVEKLGSQFEGDFKAFLDENGFAYQPPMSMKEALLDLGDGQTPTAVMNRHQVVIVSHGGPNTAELEIFRKQVVQGLGYCPPSLV